MGLIRTELELTNADDLALLRRGHIKDNMVKKMKANFLVDGGAYMLAINENIRVQLDLPLVDKRLAEMADGTMLELDVVGPIEVRFQNRRGSFDAMVLPGNSECLLGAIPMQDLDLVLLKKKRRS